MTRSYAEILRSLAADRPEAPALTYDDQTWTFAELHTRSSRTAQALRAAGVQAGDRVGLLTRNCAECFELLFACSKIGAVYTGLNWRLAAAEIAAILDDAKPALLIVGATERSLLDGSKTPRTVELGAEFSGWRDAHPAIDPGHAGAPDEPILLLYTSGTTGLPKGAMITNEGLSYTPRLAAQAWAMGPDSVNLVAMPMFHIGGCGYGSSVMTVGGHTVLLRDVVPAQVVDCISRYRVTHAFFVPTVVQSLLNVPGVDQADLGSLELLMYGAAPMGDVLLKRAISVLRCRFMQAYGMTETAGTVTVLNPEDHVTEGPHATRLNSVGRPLPWVELRIVDPDTLDDAPPGQVGEIWIRTAMNMAGYWSKPEETRTTIMPGQWLRTGDAAYLDAEGYVYLFDRFKDMIISGGENIYPAEIENVLNGHPAVLEVGVIGVPHERWGESPRAVVVLRPNHTATAEELIRFTRDRLAHYKCPTSVAFASTLPRNASGKLLKRALRLTHSGNAQ
jgi:long-chain acyl-CoA synthetase